MLRRLLLVVGIFVASFAMPGCAADQIAQAKRSREDAAAILSATTQAVEDLQQQMNALPADDPARADLLRAIDDGQRVIAAAQQAMHIADGTIESLETGQADHQLIAHLAKLPYGGYVVMGLSVGFAVWRLIRQRQADHTLRQVVRSWDAIYSPMSDGQKRLARQIQGDDATRVVHQIKAQMAM